jgi:molybdenum cofactor cytidylyltransferase
VSSQRVAGIILAAGNSKRMGTPKALLKIGSSSFLNSILTCLKNTDFTPLYIVLGDDYQKISESIIPNDNLNLIRNPHPHKGQLYSLQCVLKELPENIMGCLMVLVDHPLVSASTYFSLYEHLKQYPEKIIIPVYKRKRGHPVYFSKKFFADLMEAPITSGAKYVVKKYSKDVLEMNVADQGILIDIDTPEEYITHMK